MKLAELTDSTLNRFLEESLQPTVLTFHAAWSKPARTVINVVGEVSESYGELVRFGLVNIDHAQDAVNNYGILTIPTFLLFKNGKLTDRFIGLLTKQKLTEKIENSLQSN